MTMSSCNPPQYIYIYIYLGSALAVELRVPPQRYVRIVMHYAPRDCALGRPIPENYCFGEGA